MSCQNKECSIIPTYEAKMELLCLRISSVRLDSNRSDENTCALFIGSHGIRIHFEQSENGSEKSNPNGDR